MVGHSFDFQGALVISAEGRDLRWQNWNDFYIVYQPSSTETHIFNETTAQVLRCLGLKNDSCSMEELRSLTVKSLEIMAHELETSCLAEAVYRLIELGLVDWSEQSLHHS